MMVTMIFLVYGTNTVVLPFTVFVTHLVFLTNLGLLSTWQYLCSCLAAAALIAGTGSGLPHLQAPEAQQLFFATLFQKPVP